MAKATVRTILLVGLVWALLAQTVLAEEVRRYVVEGSKAAELDACVEPTERMRRMHFEFIKHQRIATVHQGIRGTKYSLAGCVDCHISYDEQRQPQPIDRPDQFCGACHAYAAVDLNCFDCHASVPNRSEDSPEAQAAHQALGLGPLGSLAQTHAGGGER
ncbi:sulfur reduction protein DsrJ [Imhoffiella purpurea]|uniref:Sulfite reduction-associated complex DsrMKJOP multiheme protein DsrJ n=1 Tax=Imhoffiella purpurea TaxID=1249627 RepID=W9V5G0_9GAMM|nr:sulfur reduction protein DsrJ [Imhoffiella purpurea]EXJ14783.1 Sulfite reduction-associated complex DsrMKJOP multiheme protein DsrJ [Imhoffiella purpurea]